MKAEPIQFRSGKWEMEGLYHAENTTKAAVITHPHPLYGGDMHNPLVWSIAAAYQECGFATLRFNFRGTGNSAGTHDHGIGEQADVNSAVVFLKANGFDEIHLSGYSFGAWVNAMAIQGGLCVQGLTMVAPPVAFIDFEAGIRLPMLSVVVAGSRDEIGPPDHIRPLAYQWNPIARLEVIAGADHFFSGLSDQVTAKLIQDLQPGPLNTSNDLRE